MGTQPSVDRRRFVQLSGAAAAALLAGCTGQDGAGGGGLNNTTDTTMQTGTTEVTNATETTEEATTTAQASAFLRAAHLSPRAPDVDVYVDDQLAFEGAQYTTVTPYAGVTAGEHDVRVTAAGDESTVVFDQTVTVAEGFQTAAAYGELRDGTTTTTTTAGTQTTTTAGNQTATTTAANGTTATTTAGNGTTTTTTTGNGTASRAFAVSLLEDESEAPSADESLARLFHASPDAPPVEVFAAGSGDVVFDGVAFGEASDYQTLEAGTYTLGLRPDAPDEDEALGEPAANVEVELDGGTAVTLFATGYVETSEQDLALNIVSAVDGRTSEPDG